MDANTKTFVIDSSVILAVLMPDEKESNTSQKFIKLLEKGVGLVAPNLLEFEVGNSLKSAVLSKRITSNEAKELFDTFNDFPISYKSIEKELVLKISLNSNLSFYDASYLCLAKKNKCKLLTLDKTLLKMLE